MTQALDNSASLEIDQPIKCLSSQKNSEVGVSFLGKSWKLLTSFWEKKKTKFKKVLQEKHVQVFLGKKIEQTGVYLFLAWK